MCLDIVYDDQKKKRMLDALPDGWIEVYKVVRKQWRTGRYGSLCQGSRLFRAGTNLSQTSCFIPIGWGLTSYMSGYHSFRAKSTARDWCGTRIRCYIRKEWITDIGSQDGVVYVTNRIKMPSHKDETALFNAWQ